MPDQDGAGDESLRSAAAITPGPGLAVKRRIIGTEIRAGTTKARETSPVSRQSEERKGQSSDKLALQVSQDTGRMVNIVRAYLHTSSAPHGLSLIILKRDESHILNTISRLPVHGQTICHPTTRFRKPLLKSRQCIQIMLRRLLISALSGDRDSATDDAKWHLPSIRTIA